MLYCALPVLWNALLLYLELAGTEAFTHSGECLLIGPLPPGLQMEAWAAGGSGVLLKTLDGGKTWTRDRAAENVAANLYSVK